MGKKQVFFTYFIGGEHFCIKQLASLAVFTLKDLVIP